MVSISRIAPAQMFLVGLIFLIVASSILGGPLGLIGRGERHVLLLAIVAVSVLTLWQKKALSPIRFFRSYPVALAPLVFFLVNSLWLFPLAGYSTERLQLAVTDMQSLVLMPVTVLVLYTLRDYGNALFRVGRLMVILCALLALMQSLIWGYLRFNPLPHEVIYQYVEMVFGTRESVYILEQPSYLGSYLRVVWISSYWLLFAVFLAPVFIRHRHVLFLIQTILGLAIIASYTRGIWVGVILGAFVLMVAMSRMSRQSWSASEKSLWLWSLMGAGFAIFLTLLVDWASGNPGLMLSRFAILEPGTTTITDVSSVERLEQTRLLIEKWLERPLMGHGYGAFIEGHFSHAERPFLYEMVPFALLMKLGIVGFAFYLLFHLFIVLRLFKLAACRAPAAALLAATTGHLTQAHTNPVFFSFTGMLIFSVLVYFWLVLEMKEQQAQAHTHA